MLCPDPLRVSRSVVDFSGNTGAVTARAEEPPLSLGGASLGAKRLVRQRTGSSVLPTRVYDTDIPVERLFASHPAL